MEGFLGSLIVLLVVAVAVLGPAGFLLAVISRKRLREIEKELHDIRLKLLEADLKATRAGIEAEPAASAVSPARQAEPEPVHAHRPPLVRPIPAVESAQRSEPPRSAGTVPVAPATRHRTDPTRAEPAPPPRPPSAPPAPRRVKGRLETLEAVVGGAWLNRLGVALLVIGLIFGLGYSFARLGPAGKVALATAVAISMIAAGAAFERRARWRDYGRALMAGGWAALYATAYAVHGIGATRIVESPLAGFLLLLLVAGGMIAHSLRYSSQTLTSLAYGLAYAAIAIHSVDAYTLAAGTVLGAGVVVHLLRRQWQTLAWEGMAATYGSLLLWYLRLDSSDPAALRLGLAALLIDWLVFLVADFSPEARDRTAGLNAQSISILNAGAAGMLGLFIWMKLDPLTTWAPLAGLGVSYAVMSTASRRAGRSSVHPIHSAAAVLLLGGAAQQRFDLEGATWCWLGIAEGAFLIGVALRDRFHRLLGCAAFLAPSAAIVYAQIGARLVQADGLFDLHRLLLAAAACGCFYLTYMKLGAAEGGVEDLLRPWFSWASFTLIALSLWVQLPVIWLAPALAVLLLLLFEISVALRSQDLRSQAYVAASLSVLAMFVSSATSTTRLGGWDARWLTMGVVAAAGFAIFLRLRSAAARLLAVDSSGRALFAWGGALTTGSIIWLLARPAVVGPLWVLFALILVEAGIALREADLRRPGYAALLAGQISLALSNLATTERLGSVSLRLATVLPSVIASYYVWWRLRDLPRTGAGDERDEAFGRVVTWLAAALGGMFVRFEFGLANASLRWSLGMLVLMGVGHVLRDADLRLQAWMLAFGLAVRAIAFDFQQSTPVLGIDGPLACAVVTVGSCVAAAVFMKWRADSGHPRPDRRSSTIDAWLQTRGFDVLSILAVSLAAVYSWRVHSGFLLIVAWALEGLGAAACGFGFQARSLRLAGLGLLGAGLAMTMYRTATTFDTLGRIVSFTVLGIVLLLVSFGYTKYREAVRRSS